MTSSQVEQAGPEVYDIVKSGQSLCVDPSFTEITKFEDGRGDLP